ncbi:MAG: DUF1638 domain-containing protein [Syntrophobacteraceae bacterium]
MSSRVLIACRVMKAELDELRGETPEVEVRYLDQGLHMTPQKMPALIQEQVDAVSGYAEEVVLAYGLCANGIVGVVAPDQGLLVPRCHDCIALFMGSMAAYDRAFGSNPATFYLTRGWIEEGKDPLGIVENEYTARVGRDRAIRVMRKELKHYTHFTFIASGHADLAPYRERARENAVFFGKNYSEIPGSIGYLERMIRGPFDREDFFRIDAGRAITQEMFLIEADACA